MTIKIGDTVKYCDLVAVYWQHPDIPEKVNVKNLVRLDRVPFEER